MRNLFKPKWIFIINTLPIMLLFFLYYEQFGIIKSLLNEESIHLWISFAWVLGILGSLNFFYGIYLVYKKQPASFLYGILALLCYIPFIYLYGMYSDRIIPVNVPLWMISGNMIVYAGTFLMPTLAYSLFILVAHVTPESKEHKGWPNFVFAIVVPIAIYLFFQVIVPFWKPVDDNFTTHAILILFIIATLIFLFFLVRGLYIIISRNAGKWQQYQLVWKIPIAIVLPIIGLLLNNGELSGDFGIEDSGFFGNFSNYWFYALALINGLFICLPDSGNKIYRLLLFFGRSTTFAYTFYFFLVFLPFLPLSVVAILLIGSGFLMLTPLLLFVLHAHILSKDFRFLKPHYPAKRLGVASVAAFLIIPFFITISYLNDKSTLDKALDYVYTPDYTKSYDIDETSLQKTMNVIIRHKDPFQASLTGTQIPYLTSYFNWLVLDNLMLSNSKINTIEKVFFNKTPYKLRQENIQNDNVDITGISTQSTYDSTQHAWKSWVNLEITDSSASPMFAEYATTISLPEGCWISNFYLNIGDRKEMGILAEKKSAMWIFSNIRNERRDPGIMYYLTGNKVAFRIYPFSQGETRKAGFELLHRDPVELTIDGKTIKLGNTNLNQNTFFVNKNMVYVPASEKQHLNVVTRHPYFHFIVNVSQKKNLSDFSNRITKIIGQNPSLTANAKISFVNSCVTTYSLDDNWKTELLAQKNKGGFFLERGIKTALFDSYQSHSDFRPVIVVVTDSIQKAILKRDFSDWKFTFPESNRFYILKENGELEPHSLTVNPALPVQDSSAITFNKPTLAYPLANGWVAYLPNDDKPSVILKSDTFEVNDTEITKGNWASALLMQGKWDTQTLHPELSDKDWLKLVRYSFISQVMTPVTSYLVVENDAQKAMLKKKQKQVLSGNKSLDPGEDTERMSEPGLAILTILFGLFIWLRRKRQR